MANDLKPVVLVVEDEISQLELLAYNLEKEGYEVLRAMEGEEALLIVEESAPDLIVLDWMLPQVSGIEVCRRLKNQDGTRQIPIIMLTARGEEQDRVRGLNTGADDFVVKPYSLNEMMARVRAMLRRTRPASIGQKLVHGDIVVDTERHRVTRGEDAIHLGPTEYRLLCVLMERPGRVMSRDQLLDVVWGRDKDVDHRTVDVHIGRLRKALSKAISSDPIRTVRGAGYSIDHTT